MDLEVALLGSMLILKLMLFGVVEWQSGCEMVLKHLLH